MHDSVIFFVSFTDIEGFRGLGHYLIIQQIFRISLSFSSVDHDDILKGREFRNNLNNFLFQRRTGNQYLCLAICQTVLDCIRSKGGEEWPDHATRFKCSKNTNIYLGDPFQEKEDPVSSLDAKLLDENVGELVTQSRQILEGIFLSFASFALPHKSLLIPPVCFQM